MFKLEESYFGVGCKNYAFVPSTLPLISWNTSLILFLPQLLHLLLLNRGKLECRRKSLLEGEGSPSHQSSMCCNFLLMCLSRSSSADCCPSFRSSCSLPHHLHQHLLLRVLKLSTNRWFSSLVLSRYSPVPNFLHRKI